MTTTATPTQQRRAKDRLLELYDRSGCVRVPNPDRREADSENYKKGYELRFVAYTQAELREIRRLLRTIGCEPTGTPYPKRSHMVQPVYGLRAVMEVCEALGID